jgi:hypothetical protein
MTMRRQIVAAALLLACSAGAVAQQGGGVEQLFMVPPPDWTVGYHDQKGATDLTALLPPGQTRQNWSEMLTVELISGRPAMDVQTTLGQRLDAIRQDCDDVGAGPAQLAVENGYDTGIRAIACPKSKRWGKGELSLYKVILGRSRTYVISRHWSGEPFAKDHMPVPARTTEEWLAFMTRVVVCDSGDRQHPCPTSK